jgi:ABC-type transporter Mla subunit MlaD
MVIEQFLGLGLLAVIILVLGIGYFNARRTSKNTAYITAEFLEDYQALRCYDSTPR